MTDAFPSLAEEVDRLIARTRPGYSGRTRWGFADAVRVFSAGSEVAWNAEEQLEVLTQLGRYMGRLATELQMSVSGSSVNEEESPALAALLCTDEEELWLDQEWVAQQWGNRAGELSKLTKDIQADPLAHQAALKSAWAAHLQAMELYQRKMVLDY